MAEPLLSRIPVIHGGFTGTLCQEAVVFCDESPCHNGALCVMEDHNATCYCVPDYHGTHCQDQYNDCLPYAPRCMNGGECIDGVDSFLCSCPSPSSGVLCQCLTTPRGQICQQLPHWYQDKPYQPVGVVEDVFHHWVNVSHVFNESLTDYFPSPTSTDDTYVYPTSSVDISDYDVFPTETVSPSIEVVSTLSPTLPRELPPSSVISAKESPVYSELESSSVPYSSSELFESIFPSASIFPSTMEWSEFWSIEPSPVLPIAPSSPVEDSAVLSSEFVTSTSVPDIVPTHVLEDSFPTLSVELVSLSIVSVFDVSTTPVFDSLPALEPTPVLSIASSFLETATSVLVEPPTSVFVEPAISVLTETATSVFVEPATSILIDTTASSPTYTSDIVTATFLPDDDGLRNQTFTPEADLASTPPILLPGDDASTDTTRFTEDFTTLAPPASQLPENETSYPTGEEDEVTESYNATGYITLGSEEPSLTTTSFTTIPSDNFTDVGLGVSTTDTTPAVNATGEPFTTIYDTVVVPIETATPPSSRPPEYEDTGGLASSTDSASSTTPPGYEDTGGTTPTTDYRPTDGGTTFFTPDTERHLSSTITATTKVYVNITTVSMDEYDENTTSPAPTDEYNATVTVPPDITTVDAVNVTVNETLRVTEAGLALTPGPTPVSPVPTYTAAPTPATHVTMHDNISTYMPPFNESLFITDVFYNESFTSDFTTIIDSTFTTDYTPTNVSYITDMSVFDDSSTTHPTLLDDSFTTELSTYDTSFTSEFLYPNESFTTANTSTVTPHFTTIFSYVTEKTTVSDTYTADQTTPDDYYIKINDTSTAVMTTTESTVETSSVSLPTEAPLTDTAEPLTEGLPVTEGGPQTLTVTKVQTEAGVTTDGEVDEPSITRASSTTLTTGLVDVFTVVTQPPQDLENVTIPDSEFLYNASVNGFNITSTAISPVATEIPVFPKPEVPLLPATSESATEVPPTQTPVGTTEPSVTPLPLFPLTTSTSVTFTTAAPNVTFQVPTTLTPTSVVPGLATTTEPDEDDHTASSSVEEPVLETTSQRPREPPTTLTDTSVVPTTTSTTRPTALTPTETQSDQPPAVACGTGFCLNAGICVFRDANFSCQCPFNYRGASCEVYFYINKPYFVGASYLGVYVGNMSLRRGVQVYVQFTSQDPNGLVAYSEGSSDAFFMLLLRNSLLQFVFSCGLQTVSFLQGNDKLSRNYLTDVSVRMWWTPYRHDAPWGPGMCSASMQVNGTAPIYSEQRSSSPWVRLGLLYLGGLPSSYSSPLVVKAGFLPRLKGCVSLLEVNGREVDTWVSSVSGERVEECGSAPCPSGSCYNGGSCVPGPALWSCRCPPGVLAVFSAL
nr:protein eyes shut-like [Procambarus clarkii]